MGKSEINLRKLKRYQFSSNICKYKKYKNLHKFGSFWEREKLYLYIYLQFLFENPDF